MKAGLSLCSGAHMGNVNVNAQLLLVIMMEAVPLDTGLTAMSASLSETLP